MPFQCSSASRKFLNSEVGGAGDRYRAFQCSSASRKFLNTERAGARPEPRPVSVLFSEPKIPQHCRRSSPRYWRWCFSALQRAENSSTRQTGQQLENVNEFQCSSASRKFLKVLGVVTWIRLSSFQCSSASRKFLNQQPTDPTHRIAQFQCSSASRKFLNANAAGNTTPATRVSVLFSEPKIPQPTIQ